MDKLVRRVTVVQGSGPTRNTNVVYSSEDDDGDDNRLERVVRQFLKAQAVAAQDAYQRHLDAVAKGGNSWMFDDAVGVVKSHRRALKEMRKVAPFKKVKDDDDDDEDEDEEN